MKRMKSLAAFFLIAGVICADAATEKDVWRVLKEQGINFDTNAVQRAVVDSILKAVDPRARVMGTNEAAEVADGVTITTNEEWQEGICYLKLAGLYEGGETQVINRLREWSSAGKCGVIMDMRGAGGKNLSTVDGIASVFAPINCTLYSIRNGKGKEIEKHEAIRERYLAEPMPLILLINDETRDACEILAAVLKGTKGVMLLGTNTKGDNAIREILPLSAGERVSLATRWAVPANGIEYNGAGVQPDIIVTACGINPGSTNTANAMEESDSIRAIWKPLSDKAKLDRNLMQRVAADGMILRATDILLGLKGLRSNATDTNTVSSAGE
jgi:C-terminal processing protease CtpA/Prc